MADLTTRRYKTGIIHLLSKTPIEWYSKFQYFGENDTYGSEYAAYCICNNHIVDLHNNLRYRGVPLQMVN